MSEIISRSQVPADAQVVSKSQYNAGLIGDLSPADIIKSVELDKQDVVKRAMQVQEASRRAEEERNQLYKYLHSNANPSPITLGISIALLLVSMYVIYCLFAKPNASGEWRDSLGGEWMITHGAFSSDAKVRINGKCGGVIKIIDNFVRYGNLVGVWDYNNEIVFTEGITLNRVV